MTNDGGVSWKMVVPSKRPYALMWNVSLPTRMVGYTTMQNNDPDKAVSRRYVAKMIDGGLTWTSVEIGRAVNKIRLLPTGSAMVVYAIGSDVHKLLIPRHQ